MRFCPLCLHHLPARQVRVAIIAVVVTLNCLPAVAFPKEADGSPGPGILLLDDFENFDNWTGLQQERNLVHRGAAAGRWDNHPRQPRIQKNFAPALDLSRMQILSFWAYSAKANGAQIEILLDSENPGDPAGWDYYRYRVELDWAGWRVFHIPLANFAVARNPLGWNHVNYIAFAASGWDHAALPDSLLILDDISFSVGLVSDLQHSTGYEGPDFVYRFAAALQERTGTNRTIVPRAVPREGYPFRLHLPERPFVLQANRELQAEFMVTIPAAGIRDETRLDMYRLDITFADQGSEVEADGLTLQTAIPLPGRSRPHLLIDAEDVGRINRWSTIAAWAAAQRNTILQAADAWPTNYMKNYFLQTPSLPPEGGQWGMWYICPQHSVSLRYEGPGRNVCPLDGKSYSGWPYDQVIYSRMHDELARTVRDLGLAYRLTGEPRYAASAAALLLAYADAYLKYPMHDVNNKLSGSGAHVHAQTLDESVWLIPIAWAYDLISDAQALNAEARRHIEWDLLRAAASTIDRNRAGKSNWQSWHNAGMGAVGFALDDPVMIARVLRDPANSFAFQMQASVTLDGFWYEGSWGYHFYALQAHRYLAEMAARNGLNLYAAPALRRMYEAPLQFALPDKTLPSFNDSSGVRLTQNDSLYESAYRRYEDPLFTVPISATSRGRDALLWGTENLPEPALLQQKSMLFPEAGYAVLRLSEGMHPLYLALDFGPHGGGHGHYDKLGFVLFARGTMMGVDPGTQSYAAPTHSTWDKATLAHNTVVIDERSQAEATGALRSFAALPGLAFAAADAGQAYPSVSLLRMLIATSDYVIDQFDVSAADGLSHKIDWIYHNYGTLSTNLQLPPYHGLSSSNGYQHLADAAGAAVATDWKAVFQMTEAPGKAYGTVWSSPSSIKGTFTTSNEQAAMGRYSGRLTYDFSSAAGYILYTANPPKSICRQPAALRMSVYGDGSGNLLSFRLYDSTDERFVKQIGSVNWNGWRTITAADLPAWSHFQGNDDGRFDPPLKQVSVQINSQSGKAVTGMLYVDDMVVTCEAGSDQVIEDFELVQRAMRLSMLGQPETTVVTGKGLGPNIQEPVPFAMARRVDRQTRFAALMEPMGDEPPVKDFRSLGDSVAPARHQGYAISTASYTDQLLGVPNATGPAARNFGNSTCDGNLCLIRRDLQGRLLRLVLAGGTFLDNASVRLLHAGSPVTGIQVDYSPGKPVVSIHIEGEVGSMRIWAPGAAEVRVNDSPCPFARQGDYLIPYECWQIKNRRR